MPKLGAAVLCAWPLVFQPSLGTITQTCGDDEVCLLQRSFKEQAVAVEAGNPAEEGVYDFDEDDAPSKQCSAVGAKMWMFGKGIQETAKAISVRSMKDVSSDVPDFNGRYGWSKGGTYRWTIRNAEATVSLGSVLTENHPRHGVWMNASEVKVDFKADYRVKRIMERPPISEGKVSTTTHLDTSMAAIFFLNIGKDGRLDLDMQSDWKLVFETLKIDGEDMPDFVMGAMKVSIEHNLNQHLKQNFDKFVQSTLRPKLLAQDMVIPIRMNSPLDGFSLRVPICSLDIDQDQLVFNVEGVISHPDAGNLTYDVPMPVPLLDQPPNQAQQFLTDVTEWSLNGGLWLAYHMGRFHLTPNTILGNNNKEKSMRGLAAVAESEGEDERGSGILDFYTEVAAFKAPNASFTEDGKVQLTLPLDVNYMITSWAVPEMFISIRSTSIFELSVGTPKEDKNPIRGKFNLLDVGEVHVRFSRNSKVHFNVLDAFVEDWMRDVMVPVMDYIISRYSADFGYLDDISEETSFDNTIISTFKQHMLLATDMQVGPF